MKRLSTLFTAAIVVLGMSLTSCSKDDDVTPEGPMVSTTSDNVELKTDGQTELSFSFNAPAGYKASNSEVAGGSFLVDMSAIEDGATSGVITGVFTANSTAGAAFVKLIINDSNGKSGEGTINIKVTTEN